MFQYDFSNHQNRHIRIMDMPAEYFQRIQETTRNDPYYPVWHIAPKCGLMNDPNGLCEINGIHHIFYQWFPAGPVHGLKHWYHLTTKDFIHYEDHGVAMYPDTESDSFGCYTGLALKEGEQVGEEGCLSVIGESGIVRRPNVVKVRAYNRKGQLFEIEGEELLARAFCHEIDHLDGIL